MGSIVPQTRFEDVAVGQELPALVKTCTPRQLVQWAAASGDFYEIHYDLDHARRLGHPGLLVHGALKHAFLGQLLHEWVAPAGRIVSFGCSYRGVDRPGQPITVRGVVVKAWRDDGGGDEGLVELEVWCEDESGSRTTPGTAVVALPAQGRS
jgi:acyl dehydratase